MRHSLSTLIKAVVLGGGLLAGNVAGLVSGRFEFGLPIPARTIWYPRDDEPVSSKQPRSIVCGYRSPAGWILPVNLGVNVVAGVAVVMILRRSVRRDSVEREGLTER